MALLTVALLTVAVLTMVLLTMALLTMAVLTVALLTMALLTMALPTMAVLTPVSAIKALAYLLPLDDHYTGDRQDRLPTATELGVPARASGFST